MGEPSAGPEGGELAVDQWVEVWVGGFEVDEEGECCVGVHVEDTGWRGGGIGIFVLVREDLDQRVDVQAAKGALGVQ